MVAFFADVDALLTPALGERPVRDRRARRHGPRRRRPRSTARRAFTPFTATANVTGQPAISLPLFHGDDGLPLAVQLIGRPADEATLLALAAQLEDARPWADRRAPVAATAGA